MMLGSLCSGEGGGRRERDVGLPPWAMAHSVSLKIRDNGTDKGKPS